jgi:hypothetical protein
MKSSKIPNVGRNAKRRTRPTGLFSLLALLLPACTVGPDYHPPIVPTPNHWVEPLPPSPNAIELSRHSGMDRRNPDCMDASKTRHPWSLDSGDPCRNDGEILNSTALG